MKYYSLIVLLVFNGQLHACGIAVVRLLKPLSYFQEQYNDAFWGLHKTYLLMEKQRNRGQDGAGLAVVKFDMPVGMQYMHRARSNKPNAIATLFESVTQNIPLSCSTIEHLKNDVPYLGELYLGHLRYGTHSGSSVELCQPHIYRDIVAAKQLVLIGNFNLTNNDELFTYLNDNGLNPTSTADTHLILQSIAHETTKEYERLLFIKKYLTPHNGVISCNNISSKLSLHKIITRASQLWDGGYVFAGALGTGDLFICRDPAGIRPCYYVQTDETFAAASERAALLSVFNTTLNDVHELPPGHVLILKKKFITINSTFLQTSR